MGNGPLSGAYDSLVEKLIATPSPKAFNHLLDKNTNLLDGSLLEAFDRLIRAAGESERGRIIGQIRELTRRRICDAIFQMLLQRIPDISAEAVRPHLDILLSDAGAYTLHALKQSLGGDAAKTQKLELLTNILQQKIYQLIKTTLSATGILRFLKNASLYLIDEKLQHRFFGAMADPEFDNRRQSWITLFFSKATYVGPEAAFKDVSLDVLNFLGPEAGGGLLTAPQRLEQLFELADLTRGEPQAWSGAKFFIGEIYLGMGKAGFDEDIQRAISQYEEAISVMDRERNATYWTRVKLAIGKAWLQRDGDIQANQEKAKEAFRAVSEAMPRERSPTKWSSNQMEMGIAWYKSPKGDRDQNMRMAIGCYQRAGEVLTIEFNKVGYNNVAYNLGLAFYYLQEPDRAANIRQSLDHFAKSRAALDAGRAEAEADIDYFVGNLYGEQYLAGDASSLQPAIRHLESAMLFLPGRRSLPGYGWTLLRLADLYVKDKNDFVRRIEQARDCYEAAASAFDPKVDLPDWILAHVQAGRLSLLGKKEDKEAAKRAIGHYEKMVEFLGRDRRSEIPWFFFCDVGEAFLLMENGETTLKALSFFEEAFARYPVESQEEADNGVSKGGGFYDKDFLLSRIGYLYSILREGNLLDNIEKGIAWQKLALEAADENTRPLVWAGIQNHIGVAYADRLAGDPTENQEEALGHYELALSKCPPTDKLWGDIQFNMAKTWCERNRGDHAANIEKGIESLNAALTVRTRERSPEKWANTQEYLGNAYSMRVDGKPAENIELAMQCYQAGLEVYTTERNPAKWAHLQLNLGLAYIDEKSDPGKLTLDYRKGIEHLQHALQATDVLRRPYEWAMIQMNLGTAFSQWQPDDGERHKQKSVELFREAASVYTREAYPADCRRLQIKLGHVLYELQRYPESRVAFEEAHRANELLRSQWQRPGARKELSVSNTLMYGKLVHCCLMEKDSDAAFYYATAAKSRSLLDGLNMPAESIEKLLAADEALAVDWGRIVQERARLDAFSVQFERQVTEAGREQLLTLMQDQRVILDNLLDEAMFNYPKLVSREAARLFSSEELQRMSADLGDIPMIEYYRHEGGWSAFVVSASRVEHVALPEKTDSIVDSLSRWIVRYGNDRIILADEKLTHNALFLLFEYFIRPLAEILPNAGKLVIAPFDQLHLFPLHCALELEANRYLWEDYCITYIPGLQALRLLQEQQKRDRAQRPGALRVDGLLSVAYTAADLGRGLQHVLAEADAIRNYFAPPPGSIYLEEDSASPEEVLTIGRDKTFSTLHFGCHGFFDFDDAEHSGLLLSSGWLTIDRIQTELRLMHYPMVVLSACETGRSRQEGGDNSTGLIQSFLTSGAGVVIASLWTVDDESTRHLFTSFYRNRQVEGLSTAEALRAAMRDVSNQPGWKDPFYWAAFRVTGVPEVSK